MLTKRQKQVLDFIKHYKDKHDYAPSLEEIKKHLRLSSVSTAHYHVQALQNIGYLRKEENQPRALDVFAKQKLVQIPLLGKIAAGAPIEAIEDKESIAVPQDKVKTGNSYFALKVSGNSMVDENIDDGDIVIVKKQANAENGQKVVALIDNSEVTLKCLYREKGYIKLQPANPQIEPIIVKPENLTIQGVIIDVIKHMGQETAHPILKKEILKDRSPEETKYIQENQIICGDAIKLLDSVKPNSIDMVLSDIPYGISLDEWDVLHANTNSALLGKSPAQIGKSAFKRRGKPINGWSKADKNIPKEYQAWCYSWGQKLYPLVKEGGSLFIFGARRTIHRAIMALEESGFVLRDILAWEKTNIHYRAQSLSNILESRGLTKEAKEWEGWKLGNLAPKYEPIAWLFKSYRYTITDNVLENKLGAMNIAECSINGKSPTNILKFDFMKGEGGIHEAQKPIKLLEYLIKLVTKEKQIVLDPFIGSGSTAVAAKNLNRSYIGFEISKKYCDLAKRRLSNSYYNTSRRFDLKQPTLF